MDESRRAALRSLLGDVFKAVAEVKRAYDELYDNTVGVVEREVRSTLRELAAAFGGEAILKAVFTIPVVRHSSSDLARYVDPSIECSSDSECLRALITRILGDRVVAELFGGGSGGSLEYGGTPDSNVTAAGGKTEKPRGEGGGGEQGPTLRARSS